MNDFRKIELFDPTFVEAIKKNLEPQEQTKFFNCVRKLPYEIIIEILNKYLKQKCVQIN